MAETKEKYVVLKREYDTLFADRTYTMETKAEQAHQGQIQQLFIQIDDLEKEKNLVVEKLSAISGEHPHFSLPLEYNNEDIVRTKRSEVKHESAYR